VFLTLVDIKADLDLQQVHTMDTPFLLTELHNIIFEQPVMHQELVILM